LRTLVVLTLALYGAVISASAEPNRLTPEEVADGWILLFDGESDFGWEHHMEARWTVRDGELRSDGGGYGWIGTTATFGDFHLKLEFKTAEDGNSGVFLRSARQGLPHRTGYELQIYDDQPQGFNTGSLVFYAKPTKPAMLKPDLWNQYDIRVEGSHFLITLNGEVVFDGDNPTHAAGVIGLQYNPEKPIAFRDVKLKPLSLKPLFNGEDLKGWKKVDRPNRNAEHLWTVRNGILHVEKGPGQLETESQFKNFVLQLGVRTAPARAGHHPNSGVFLRGSPGVFWSGYESQIRNEYQHDDRTLPVDTGTGGIYFFQPTRRVVSNDGEFFYKTIVANGRHISVWVDGIQVSDYEDVKPEGPNWRKQARLDAGTISLQAHDPTTNLDFKDIRAGELPAR